MKEPISTIEHNMKISVISGVDSGFCRNAMGDVVLSVPTILITADFRGTWSSAAARDADLQKTVDALMASYKNYATQSKAP